MHYDEPPLDGLRVWLESTAVSQFVNWSPWAWPVLECLHFVGLSVLFGTVVLFDLRLLGLVREVPPQVVARLVPWGIGGFCLSAVTGALFFTGIPGMYLNNPAFWTKCVCLLLAGLNVLVYTLFLRSRVESTPAHRPLPRLAAVVGVVSLVLWIAVLASGRLIGFFKP
ncbi:MAG: DUF6644 family protein [Acidobacteriota bacterium]